MKRVAGSWSRVAVLAAISLVAGCAGPVDGDGTPEVVASSPAIRSELVGTTTTTGDVCAPSGAHGRHQGIIACTTCHACGGWYQFDLVTMPGGTSTAGGTMTLGNPTTCSVGCHAVGGTGGPSSIAWNEVGPLACTSCHVQPTGALTKHAVGQADPLLDRAGCSACHVTDRHLSGTVRIDAGDEVIDANRNDAQALAGVCKGCHDGAGMGIGEFAPPVLVGWADLDFHGDRIGTGTSNLATLIPPYIRGEPAMPCTSCHETHASPNAYLFAAPSPIDRAGVGAERLCAQCHQGERHGWCMSCHGVDPMPAGAPCFFCHSHEGVSNFVPPSDYQHDGSEGDSERCWHCHSNWAPPALEYVAPAIVNNFVNIQESGPGSATVAWTTSEPATGFVEWGVAGGTLDRTAGDRVLSTAHSITIMGLAGATTYSIRVRSADAFRNLTRSTLLSYSTPDPNAPPATQLVAEPDWYWCGSTANVTLEWGAVVAPNGNPIEYRVVVDNSALFDSPDRDSGWTPATQFATTFPASTYWATWYWRVQARDVVHGVTSPWSNTDEFRVRRYPFGTVCQ